MNRLAKLIGPLAIALLALPSGAAATRTPTVKAGIEAWQRADYPAAIRIWRPLAERGDADAAFNLGQAYRLGRGVPVNLAQAQHWFEDAADKGHLDAQSTLGLLLFDGGDRAEGIKWLRRAADDGEPRAMLIYGTALFNGDSVTRDPVLAYALISRAAAQGLAPAKATLAQLDTLMPVEERKQGIAEALARAKIERPAPKAVRPSAPSKPKPMAVVAARSVEAAVPAAKPAPPAASGASGASGAWRVQLGAFAKPASAEALFRQLSGTAALTGRRSFLIPAGAVTRLQAGPFASRAAAAAACAALSAKGQACFPVAAK